MQTIADLKRRLIVGSKIELVSMKQRLHPLRLDVVDMDIPLKMQGVGEVVEANTTGWYIKRPHGESKRGSFLEIPKRADVDFDGDSFTIKEFNSERTACMRSRTYKLV